MRFKQLEKELSTARAIAEGIITDDEGTYYPEEIGDMRYIRNELNMLLAMLERHILAREILNEEVVR